MLYGTGPAQAACDAAQRHPVVITALVTLQTTSIQDGRWP